jgi:hypothetical protein
LEVGDTAGLETCATNASILANGGAGKMRPQPSAEKKEKKSIDNLPRAL